MLRTLLVLILLAVTNVSAFVVVHLGVFVSVRSTPPSNVGFPTVTRHVLDPNESQKRFIALRSYFKLCRQKVALLREEWTRKLAAAWCAFILFVSAMFGSVPPVISTFHDTGLHPIIHQTFQNALYVIARDFQEQNYLMRRPFFLNNTDPDEDDSETNPEQKGNFHFVF